MSRPAGKVSHDNRGRVVLVTGGASGIGRSIAESFADSGATVFALDVNRELGESLPPSIRYEAVDVSVEAQCQALVERIVAEQELGGVDVLVNNAALQPVDSFVPLDQLDVELMRRIFDVNVSGYALMAKAVVPVMKAQGGGVIVNIASAQAHRTAREVPAYGPSKAANLMQARQWGVEYARDGIRVVSVSPGAIDTPLVRASLELQGGEGQLANRHPLGRLGKPREIAEAVLWLSSDAAAFVTATDLEVDGGLGGFAAFADPYSMPERYLNQEEPPAKS
jgi:NAD(P)-dependent dehydrogenase (short-subunit alcohol dehydrogenase family)